MVRDKLCGQGTVRVVVVIARISIVVVEHQREHIALLVKVAQVVNPAVFRWVKVARRCLIVCFLADITLFMAHMRFLIIMLAMVVFV